MSGNPAGTDETFDLSLVGAGELTLALETGVGSVEFNEGDVLTSRLVNDGTRTPPTYTSDPEDVVEVLLADNESIGLAEFDQANGLTVTGGADTDVFFRFDTTDGTVIPSRLQRASMPPVTASASCTR